MAEGGGSAGGEAAGVAPFLKEQLRLEAERVYTLLRAADHEVVRLRGQLRRSQDKLAASVALTTRLTADKIALEEESSKFKHQLELCSLAIQRNAES